MSTQTDIVGASAYMQYIMSDMPQGGTIEDLPDIASFKMQVPPPVDLRRGAQRLHTARVRRRSVPGPAKASL
eukprot:COSAG01_NODE_16554_length_1226_cov_7.354037_3_plen_71_part_01